VAGRSSDLDGTQWDDEEQHHEDHPGDAEASSLQP
jgi:hypothetical protein